VKRTRQRAEEVVSLATEVALDAWLAWGTALRGWAIAAEGRPDEGIADLHQAVAGWTAAGVGGLRPYFLTLLADAYAKAGERSQALATVAEALTITDRTGEGYMRAELHRLQGELLEDPVEAEACLERAIDVARTQGAKSFELRAMTHLCRLGAQRGHEGEARQMLAGIYGWFTEGFQTGDLREARALLNGRR
jgi:adenylate cyclase